MIHIYTGSGKGKTTSAFGLAMRASGQGLRVIIFQFLKPKSLVTGEEISAKKIKNIKLVKYEQSHPIFNNRITARTGKSVKNAIIDAKKAIFSGKYDMVILDEIVNVVDQGFASKSGFLKLLKTAPKDTELILTGRGDISEIEKFADYVTVMVDKMHPFRQEVNARRGIEY